MALHNFAGRTGSDYYQPSQAATRHQLKKPKLIERSLSSKNECWDTLASGPPLNEEKNSSVIATHYPVYRQDNMSRIAVLTASVRPGQPVPSTSRCVQNRPSPRHYKVSSSLQSASSSTRHNVTRTSVSPILISGYEKPYLNMKRRVPERDQTASPYQSFQDLLSNQTTRRTNQRTSIPCTTSVYPKHSEMIPTIAKERFNRTDIDEFGGKVFKRRKPYILPVSNAAQRFDETITDGVCFSITDYVPQEFEYNSPPKALNETEALLLETNNTPQEDDSTYQTGTVKSNSNLLFEAKQPVEEERTIKKRKRPRYLTAKEFAVFEDESTCNSGTMRKPPAEFPVKSTRKTNQSGSATAKSKQANNIMNVGKAGQEVLVDAASHDSGVLQSDTDTIQVTPSKRTVSPSYVEIIKQPTPPDHVLMDESLNVIDLEPEQSPKKPKVLSKLAQLRKDKSTRAQNRLTMGLVENLPASDENSTTLEGGNRTKAEAICENVFLNRDDWLNEPSLRLMDFFHMWKDEVKLLCWLARRRLIPNRVKCSRFNCSQQLYLVPDSANVDGWVWRCDRCRQTRSIRHRTIFKHCDLSVRTATQILYLWCIGHPTDLIPVDTDTSPEEAREWLYCIREVCRETNMELKERLGGVDEEDAEPGYCRVVEVDEALFTCRLKDRNGKDCVRKVWLVGGAERGTERVFLARCPQNSRDAFSLIPVIREFIKPGTAIITDDWEGYTPLNDLPEGYQHYVAQRSRGILNPGQEAVHIQKITCLWSHWKRSFENLNGISVDDFDACLDEYLWRMQHSKAILQSFCYSVTLLFDI